MAARRNSSESKRDNAKWVVKISEWLYTQIKVPQKILIYTPLLFSSLVESVKIKKSQVRQAIRDSRLISRLRPIHRHIRYVMRRGSDAWKYPSDIGITANPESLAEAVQSMPEDYRKIRLNYIDQRNLTILITAVRANNFPLVRWLVCHSDVDPYLMTPRCDCALSSAIAIQNVALVELLCRVGCLDAAIRQHALPLHDACNPKVANSEIVTLLVRYGADPNVVCWTRGTCMEYALATKNYKLAGLLYRLGAEAPEKVPRRFLHSAARSSLTVVINGGVSHQLESRVALPPFRYKRYLDCEPTSWLSRRQQEHWSAAIARYRKPDDDDDDAPLALLDCLSTGGCFKEIDAGRRYAGELPQACLGTRRWWDLVRRPVLHNFDSNDSYKENNFEGVESDDWDSDYSRATSELQNHPSHIMNTTTDHDLSIMCKAECVHRSTKRAFLTLADITTALL